MYRWRETAARTWARTVAIALVLTIMGSLGLLAQRVKQGTSSLDDLAFARPGARVVSQIEEMSAFRTDLGADETKAADSLLYGYDRLLSETGGDWRASVDRVSGSLVLVEGSGIPWIPGRGNGLTYAEAGLAYAPARPNDMPKALMARKALEMVTAYPELFGVDPNDLVLNETATGPVLDYLYFMDFAWTYHGIPVEHAHLVFRVNNGNLVQFGEENVSPSAVAMLDPTPSLSTETAWQIVWGYVGGRTADDAIVDEGHLLVVPFSSAQALAGERVFAGSGLSYRLVYSLVFHRPGVMGTWEARVDAHTGEVLSFLDVNDYGSIQGGVYKTDKNPSQSEVSTPFPYADYGSGQYSDAAGNFSGTTGTSTLSGKYVRINDSCGAISQGADGTGKIDFGSGGGTDCTTPGHGGSGNSHSSRTQYWNVTQIKLKAMTYLPTNTWLQGQLVDNVNLNQTCNAYWNGSSLNFFRSGGGCGNTGELPGVSMHEWGHGLDSNDGNGSSPDHGTGETYGDSTAFIQTHQSCLGGGFVGGNCSGYGDACTSCTGVRDVDYAKHSSGNPHTLTFASNCPVYPSYIGPCGREGHCESYVSSEANWDLANRDLVTWGLDQTTAWQLLDKFWYASRSIATGAFVCTVNSSCSVGNLFNVYRVVDDCDGNLANGTPHASAIYNAFSRHQIACGSAVNTDNSCGCATLSTPSLSGTAGYNACALSWGAVSGATSYDIYRNETSCTAGFTRVATVTGTSVTDTNCVNGVTYYYRVQANGAAGCPASSMSNCTTLAPVAGSTGTLSGTVLDAGSSPLSGGTVSATGGGFTYQTTTVGDGSYSLTLPVGTYTVTASMFGYVSGTSSGVSITNGGNTTRNFQLNPAPSHTISGTVTDANVHWPLYAGLTLTTTGYTTTIWTDPVTGVYSASLPDGLTYTLQASSWFSGYASSSATIGPLSSNVVHNFPLATTGCGAPGYRLEGGIEEHFEGAFPPAGWTVVDNAGDGNLWNRNDFFGATNHTLGTGFSADADSDATCDGTTWDTELRSPTITLPASGPINLTWNSNFQDYVGAGQAWVDISTNGGSTWTNVYYQTADDVGGTTGSGVARSVDLSSYVGANVMLRWRYSDDGDGCAWWWQIDDILVGSSPTCQQPSTGGLVVGNVLNPATAAGISGATVTHVSSGVTATSADTPTDSAQEDGFYGLYSSTTGTSPMTATKSGFGSDSKSPNVPLLGVVRQDFHLASGQLQASPANLTASLDQGTSTTKTLTLTNIGGASLTYQIRDREGHPTLAKTRESIRLHPANELRAESREGWIEAKRELDDSLSASAEYKGDGSAKAPPSMERAPFEQRPSLAVPQAPALESSGSLAYAVNLSGHELASFTSDAPGTFTTVGGISGSLYAGDFVPGDFTKLYVIDDAAKQLLTLSTSTGAATTIGSCNPLSGHTWTGLTIASGGTAYAASSNGSVSTLYTVNLSTGAASQVGTITNAPIIIDIAINKSGQLYGADIGNDNLVSINTTTGAGTVIGSLGYNANYAQGMDFDDSTNQLYLASYGTTSGSGALRLVDTSTGSSTEVGAFPGGAEVDCLAFATTGDVSWLSESPLSGTLGAGQSVNVTVTFNASGQSVGDHLATILVDNDTPHGTLAVPVTMTVTTSVAPPVITSMQKVGNPFRINVNGSNLQPGIRVFINGSEWTNLKYKSSYLIKLKKGSALKAVVPKNTPTQFRFLNPDGGETTLTWQWP